MKVTIKNDHPTPMEVLSARVILQPGESIELDIPDTDDKPEAPATPPPPPAGEAKKPEGTAAEPKKAPTKASN